MRKDAGVVKTFAKILRHEAELGFVDSAVVGGMDSFVEKHRVAIANSLDIGSQFYSSLTLLDREIWVNNLLKIVGYSLDNSLANNRHSPKINIAENDLNPKLDDAVIHLRSVTSRFAKILEDAFSIKTIEDLIYHLPHRHNDYSQIRKINDLKAGEEQTTIVQVRAANKVETKSKISRVIVDLYDETGFISVTFFNQPWILRDFRRGTRLMISGLVKRFKGRLVFANPSYEVIDSITRSIHAGRIVPVYDLTNGVKQRSMRRMVNSAIRMGIDDVRDHIPDVLLDKIGLMGLGPALKAFHYPRDLNEKMNAIQKEYYDALSEDDQQALTTSDTTKNQKNKKARVMFIELCFRMRRSFIQSDLIFLKYY